MFPGFIVPLWFLLVSGIILISRAAEKRIQNNKKKASADQGAAPSAAKRGGAAAAARPAASAAHAERPVKEAGSAFREMDREFHSLEFHDEDQDDCYAAFEESRNAADAATAGQAGDISHMFPGMNDIVRGVVWAEILSNKNTMRNGEENYDAAADTGTCL